jgi:hypothetical protein
MITIVLILTTATAALALAVAYKALRLADLTGRFIEDVGSDLDERVSALEDVYAVPDDGPGVEFDPAAWRDVL